MKGTEQFQETIKMYLDDRAAKDDLFAKTYKKEGKTIEGCIMYILGEVQKSKCNGFADDEIYSMAVHYYDEDNLKPTKVQSMRVVVNHSSDAPKKAKEKPKKVVQKTVEQSGLVQGSLF